MKRIIAGIALTTAILGGTAEATGNSSLVRVAPGTTVFVQQVGLQEDDICQEFLTNGDLGRIEVTFAPCGEAPKVRRTVFEDGSGWTKRGLVFCYEPAGCTKGPGERKAPKWAIREWNDMWGEELAH